MSWMRCAEEKEKRRRGEASPGQEPHSGRARPGGPPRVYQTAVGKVYSTVLAEDHTHTNSYQTMLHRTHTPHTYSLTHVHTHTLTHPQTYTPTHTHAQ